MADYHVLNTDESGNALRVVFHVAIPNLTNDAGVNYRTALVAWLGGADDPTVIQSACPFISAGELTQMQAGEVFERVVELSSNPSEDYPTEQARLDAWHATVASDVADLVQTVLQYWGYERNIP